MTFANLSTSDGRLALWRAMLDARAFDAAMCEHNPHWHEARGEEGAFIGAFSQLSQGDVAVPHFRGTCGVRMMFGADPELLAHGIFGGPASPSRGNWRGDICPMPDPTYFGMFSGSLGTSVAYATGAALRLSLSGDAGAVLCAFGDGTANAGIVAESMNLAGMLRLPIVYMCQNNQYATSLSADVALAGESVADRAQALGISAQEVDGNDPLAVGTAIDSALSRVRDGHGPHFVHALTYRMGGHYMNDPETYRTADEVAVWAERDPIVRLQRVLVAEGLIDADQAASEAATASERIGQVVLSARQASSELVPRALPVSADAEAWRAVS